MDDYNKQLDDLKKQSDDAQNKKSLLNLFGSIGDTLAATPSFGEIALGRNIAKPKVSNITGALADSIQDPVEKQKRDLALQDATQKQAQMKAAMDPNSEFSQAKRESLKFGLDAAKQYGAKSQFLDSLGSRLDGMNAMQIDQAFEKFPILNKVIDAGVKARQQNQMMQKMQSMFGNKEQLQENNIHEKILGRLQSDKNLGQRMSQYQNLGNALGNFMNAKNTTPQQLDELQQAIRSNLGIKGTSGVGEREHTYINTLGLNADRLGQFLSGDPATISKDSALIGHLKELANLEQQNISGQFDNRMKSLTSGHQIYKKRPDLKMALDDAIGAYKSQISGDSQGEPSNEGSGFPGVPNVNASDMVDVVSPQGVAGKLPKAKLDQALKRGFKVR